MEQHNFLKEQERNILGKIEGKIEGKNAEDGFYSVWKKAFVMKQHKKDSSLMLEQRGLDLKSATSLFNFLN